MTATLWRVTHPAAGVVLAHSPLLRDAKRSAEDAYKQHAQFCGDTECYAYTYSRDEAMGRLRQVANDGEQGWYTGVEIERVPLDTDAQRCCHQCGRTGTRGFVALPDGDVIHDGKVVVSARSMTECANKAACRKRWLRPRTDDE